ncbi:MAG: DNA polymerase III subunit delta' [Anaerolineaceae bacterium]|jgi:DNA polymerase-3 subunit delta'|nr:DNA polymerase III subunit delta' [Chloroflexota bacterium]UCC51701.1 MAG: DNA polymerase III subunit delta' [Anaerolineaceae bacterium]
MTGWNKLVGHDWAVQLLAGAIANGRVGHAYLITGAEQIGKTTLARTFAQALNCEAPSKERPCNQCRTCRLIASDHHPDVRFLQPQISGRGKHVIKIDQIRLLQQELNLSPYEGRTRVAILKRFDTANTNAANAFLKTLEEPPSKVVLLLTANDADSLLPTIASRCRTVGLRPVSSALIEESLMIRWGIGADEALLLSHLAEGRLGWAVQASQDNTILAERQHQLSLLRNALESQRVRRFSLAGNLARKPESLPALLKTWLSWWHDLTLLAYHKDSFVPALPISNIDQQHQLTQYAHEWNREWIMSGFKQTDLAIWQLERNGNSRLVLENLFLSYPLPHKIH